MQEKLFCGFNVELAFRRFVTPHFGLSEPHSLSLLTPNVKIEWLRIMKKHHHFSRSRSFFALPREGGGGDCGGPA